MRTIVLVLLLTVAAAARVPAATYELALGYAAPTAGDLDTGWAGGGALDLRLPLAAGPRERLTLDLGGQLHGARGAGHRSDMRGLHALATFHLALPRAGGRAQVFAGAGAQSLWTGEPEPLVGAPGPLPGPEPAPAFEGWGPAFRAGAGWTLLGDGDGGLQIQGSWTVARVEGAAQSYAVLGLAWLLGP